MFNLFWVVAVIGFMFILAIHAGIIDWFGIDETEYEDDYEDYEL